MSTGDWSDLPDLALAAIVRLLPPAIRDLFSFAAVCSSWRRLLRSLSPSLLPSIPPLLLTPITGSILTPSDPSLRFSPSPLDLPSSSLRCLSFSHGHLLLLPSSPPLQPFLADVITGSRILLPPLPSDHHRVPYYYATLTAPPSSPSCLFLLFFSRSAFLSCHVSSPDATWSRHRFSPDISFITHVIPFGNRLLGLNDRARLLELDLSSDQAKTVRFATARGPCRSPHNFDRWHFGPQLVSAPRSTQLFLVLFLLEDEAAASMTYHSVARLQKIQVYSLDWRMMEWVEVERLQDSAIFIDCGGKVPVLCEKPETWGGESNCVYVTGPGFDRGEWRRISLDEKTIISRIRLSGRCGPRWPSPVWIYPSLFY